MEEEMKSITVLNSLISQLYVYISILINCFSVQSFPLFNVQFQKLQVNYLFMKWNPPKFCFSQSDDFLWNERHNIFIFLLQ
jgi:hypothetical protein